MISVLVGENSFEVHEELGRMAAGFAGDVERYDGESLDRAVIADLFGGQTLFADERLIIIRDLSKNLALWPDIEKLAEGIADSTRIVLVEEKLDKRTAAYKALKAAGAIKEFAVWSDRDGGAAQQWVVDRAKAVGLRLGSAEARLIVERVGFDQWQLAHAVEKLSLLDAVSAEAINEHIERTPKENVFQLFELALSGKKDELRTVLRTLMLTEDPYMVFALLSSQAVQLGVMSVAHDEPATKDFGIHPFVASKLTSAARRQGPTNVKRIIHSFAEADVRLKSTAVDPWQVVETTLLTI